MLQEANQAATSQPIPCTFIPRSYHVLLISRADLNILLDGKLAEHTEWFIPVSRPTVFPLRASYVHCISGEAEHTRTFNLTGPLTLYFVACRNYPGWFYICQWSKRLERFACSCSESKRSGYCNHIDELTLALAVILHYGPWS